jgi:hypothetical protein
MLDDFQEHGPVLAVLDGRFLPVDHLKISPNNKTKTVQTIGQGSLDMTQTSSSIDIGIRTRRRPQVRTAGPYPIFIRNRKYKIVVEDAVVEQEGATMNDMMPSYDIELEAETYTVMLSSESFL